MNRSLIIGAALSAVFVLAALVSFVWTPYDVLGLDIPNKLKEPSAAHWLGTDHFGRDIFSMIMVGARTSIAVAVVAVGIGMSAWRSAWSCGGGADGHASGRGDHARQ